MNTHGKQSMKLQPLVIGLAIAGLLGAAGYGIYTLGMQRGLGMAGTATAPAHTKKKPAETTPRA